LALIPVHGSGMPMLTFLSWFFRFGRAALGPAVAGRDNAGAPVRQSVWESYDHGPQTGFIAVKFQATAMNRGTVSNFSLAARAPQERCDSLMVAAIDGQLTDLLYLVASRRVWLLRHCRHKKRRSDQCQNGG
jgi:hypothetical protein